MPLPCRCFSPRFVLPFSLPQCKQLAFCFFAFSHPSVFRLFQLSLAVFAHRNRRAKALCLECLAFNGGASTIVRQDSTCAELWRRVFSLGTWLIPYPYLGKSDSSLVHYKILIRSSHLYHLRKNQYRVILHLTVPFYLHSFACWSDTYSVSLWLLNSMLLSRHSV